MSEIVNSRMADLGKIREQIQADISKNWGIPRAIELTPGSNFLQLVCTSLGSTFKKDSGDSVRLAKFLRPDGIDKFFKELLNDVTKV